MTNEAIDEKISWIGLYAGTRRWEVPLSEVTGLDSK
jgi:hypothetical protein